MIRNTHIPAAAEGIPTFNRRSFLQGAASAGIIAGVAVAPATAEVYEEAYGPEDRLRHHLQMAAQAMNEITRADGKLWLIIACGDQEGTERVVARTHAPTGEAYADELVYRYKRARA